MKNHNHRDAEWWVPRSLAVFGAVMLTGLLWTNAAHRGELIITSTVSNDIFGPGDCLDKSPYDYTALLQRTNIEIHGVAVPGPTTLNMQPGPDHPQLATYHFRVEHNPDPHALGRYALRPTDQLTADAMTAAHCPVLPKSS